MADLNELDNILEDDLLSALDGLDDILEDTRTQKVEVDDKNLEQIEQNAEIKQTDTKRINVEANKADLSNISQLLQELLNNKTLEITIRLKD